MSQPDMSTLQNVKYDDIVHVDYDQAGLKNNFTIIVDILQKLQIAQKSDKVKIENNIKDIKDLQDKNNTLEQQNQNFQKDNSDLRNEIEQLKQRMTQEEQNNQNLKQDHDKSKERITNNENEIEDLKKNIKALLDKIRELENKVEQLSLVQPSNSGDGVDSGALQKLYGEIQKLRDEFVTKEEFNEKCEQFENKFNDVYNEIDELKKRLNKLEQQLNDIQDRLDNIENTIKNINVNNNNSSNIDPQELEELRAMIRKRVDTEKFEREINSLRQLIKQLTAIGEGKNVEIVSGMGEEEKKLLDALNEKLESLEDQVRRLRKDVDNNKNEYNTNKNNTDKRLDALENQIKFKASKEDMDNINIIINSIKEDLNQVENLAKDNEIEIKKLKRNIPMQQEQQNTNGDGISEDYLQEKLRQQKEELLILLKALQEEKVSYDDLWKSEAVILEKLDEVAGALLKKLADKVDTKKALLYLEKKINQLFVMINKGGSGQPDGDGLLVKRPLFWSCMSCDKDLNKFQGRMGDYKNWAVFPPKETTPERMGKFGIGYKSLLERSKMRDEKIKMESSQLNQNPSQDQFPPVKNPGLQGQQYENQ